MELQPIWLHLVQLPTQFGHETPSQLGHEIHVIHIFLAHLTDTAASHMDTPS